MESSLRPRDIQTRIRAGETPEAVAHAAGTSVEKIMPFAAPVMAERAHVAERAQLASVRRRADESGARTLGEAVSAHLRSHNVDPGAVEWDAWRREDGRWTLTALYDVAGRTGTGDLLPRPARQLRDRRRRRRALAGRRRLARAAAADRRARRRRPGRRPPAPAERRRRRRARLRRRRDRDGLRRRVGDRDDRPSRRPRPRWSSARRRSAPSSPSRPTSTTSAGRRAATTEDEPTTDEPAATSRRARGARAAAAREEARPRVGAELGRDHVRRRQERLSRAAASGSTSTPSSPERSGPVRSIDVLPGGLRDDRTWMVVDGDGRLVSAREVHALFHVVADTPDTDAAVTCALRLRAPGLPDLHLDEPAGEPEPVRLFSLDLRAVPAGTRRRRLAPRARSAATTYASCGATTRPAARSSRATRSRATTPPSPTRSRSPSRRWRRCGSSTTGSSSARSSSARSRRDPLPIERFRANLVVDGDEPFAEDRWQALTVGGVRFRVTKPVGRCVMTTHRPGRR